MSEEKHGVLVSLPLTCACGCVCHWVWTRWCGACGEAICPTCFPKSQESVYPYRCARCLKENRKLALEIAGEKMAMEREKRAIENFLGKKP